MNYAQAYSMLQRIEILMRCKKSSQEIIDDLAKRYPEIEKENLESVMEKISRTVA